MKKKYLKTRKQRALRWTAVALVCLLYVNYSYGAGYLLPQQTIWDAERYYSCGRTESVHTQWGWSEGMLAYLRGNENAVLYFRAKPTLTGWDMRYPRAVDCSETAPFYAGFLSLNEKTTRTAEFFGRTDDPAVSKILCTFWYVSRTDENVRRFYSFETSDKDWYEQDGQRYFLLQSRFEKGEMVSGNCVNVMLTAFDATGKAIASITPTQI